MADSVDNGKDSVPETAKLVPERPVAERPVPERLVPERMEPMEDEEKILAGRHDVNYPALLTKDVPGG